MFVADPPAASAPASQPDQRDVIEVVGTRSEQRLKIDRRTYQVQQTPHSAQKDAVQLLRGLPAVTVTPDDTVMILGSSDAKIYVDGRPYQGEDSRQYLRTLHGSDIERIEVITNPSAQYSAEGTGGIINFVLRKKQGGGLSGTTTAELSRFGHADAAASLKYKQGKWTYELEANARAGRNDRSSFRKLRSVETEPGGAATINREDGHGSSHEVALDATAKLTYDLDSRTSLSGSLSGAAGGPVQTGVADFIGVTPDFQSFSERLHSDDPFSYLRSVLAFDHKGAKDGETLTASLTLMTVPGEDGRNVATLSNGGGYVLRQDNRWTFGDAKVDWQHPLAKGQILSMGGAWDYVSERQRYAFASSGDTGALGTDSSDEFTGTSNTLAGYVTFQQAIGSWTVMPGLRVEQNSRSVTSVSARAVHIDRTNLFPTLHVEHPLGKSLDLTLSYSKRIDRAQTRWLRPFVGVDDVLTADVGNPNLRDQSADSYELNLHYHRGRIDAGVILYDRETSRLWSTDYTVIDGINLYTWVNSGHSRDSGAELDISTPLLARVKVNGSLNLFDERAPIDSDAGAASEDRFRYTTNATLEWDGPEHDRRPGDVAQLQWIYNSPSRQFQMRQFSTNQLSLSYTHSFSRTVSLTATADYASANRHILIAPLVQEDYEQRSPLAFRLRLLKTFGKP